MNDDDDDWKQARKREKQKKRHTRTPYVVFYTEEPKKIESLI